MSEAIRALIGIQDVDGQIKSGRDELLDLGRRREVAVAARASEQTATTGARELLEVSELQHRHLEAELADVEATLARLDGQIYEVTSKQAVAGLQREIAHARERKSELEDQVLEQLDAVDETRHQLEEAEALCAGGAEAGAAEAREWEARQRKVEDDLLRLDAERTEIAVGVSVAAMREYDRIRVTKWPAAILVTGDSCPGCRVAIPPQKRIEIRRSNEIATCLYCGRILYAENVLAEG